MASKMLFVRKNQSLYRSKVTVVQPTPKIITPTYSPIEMSKLKNGIHVASIRRKTDISRAVIVINAGSRHESASEKGITHVLRQVLLSSNTYYSYITNSRAIYHIGADVSIECDRDSIIIKSQFGTRYLFHMLDLIGSAICHHKYYYWEVMYAIQSCLIDYDKFKANLLPEQVLDALHGLLYRNGYGNSLYVGPDCESTIRENNVEKYASTHFLAPRITVSVESDLSHSIIEEYAEECFPVTIKDIPPNPEVKSYSGEFVIPHECRHYHNVLGYIAPSQVDSKWAVYKVLQCFLGGNREYETSSSKSLLEKVFNSSPFNNIGSFYIPYNLSGVFGIYTISPKADFSKCLQDVCKAFASICKMDITAAQLSSAKTQAKLQLSLQTSTTIDLLTNVSKNLSAHGSYIPDSGIKLIDSVKIEDIKSELTKLAATRPVVVSLGNPSFVPPADDILSWLK